MAVEYTLSPLESAILDLIQAGFPISADPYAEIGARMGCAREEAHAAVQRLRREKIIRRLGGSFASDKMGYVSTLVAAQVDAEHLESAAALAGAFDEVTHNYERNHACNLWFTIIADSPARLEAILDAVRHHPGVQGVHALPALRTFKIRVEFSFDKEARHAG